MYMAVTTDKYELPLAVADTARELGKLLNVSGNLIHSSISRNQNGNTRKMRFLKIDLTGYEE